tara:strand:- start:113 stop:634 length:522 start_codon:yes stop_codon:yes gene_type:complete
VYLLEERSLKYLAAILINLLFFANVAQSKDSTEIFEDAVYDVLENFYAVLDVKNYDKEKLRKIVTDDFLVFEAARSMDIDAFHLFLTQKDPNAEPLIHTSWQLSDHRLYLDDHSAHVSYMNRGTFQHGTTLRVTIDWMESALLVRKDEDLRIKFINANLISKDIQNLPAQKTD